MIEKPISLRQLRENLAKYKPGSGSRATPVTHPAFRVEDILHGLSEHQFEPYYQPKVALGTGRLVGAEALARWIHPEYGVVYPTAFIEPLEQGGHINELTFRILEKTATVCRFFQNRNHPLIIAVNLSLTSFDDPNLADRITRLVREAGGAPEDMILEITESAAMTEAAPALENLARLCMNGFGLSIDDYGTGYSSLQQLTRIAFSELKIDSSFVRGIQSNETFRIVVQSSIEMATRLQVRSVAEGVESQRDWNLLKSFGCNMAQGYFIAEPMNLETFIEFVANYSSTTTIP